MEKDSGNEKKFTHVNPSSITRYDNPQPLTARGDTDLSHTDTILGLTKLSREGRQSLTKLSHKKIAVVNTVKGKYLTSWM